MDTLERAALLLPPQLRNAAVKIQNPEEFRLRTGREAAYIKNGDEHTLAPDYTVTPSDLDGVLERATNASVHWAQNSVNNGFVTVRGGIRIGICGAVVMKDGEPSGVRSLSSLAVRIPWEARGCCDGEYDKLTRGGFDSTLIISRPGGGKTTYLRELIRRLSQAGHRVALADERGEVAACFGGEPQFDVGERTDIMSDCPKARAAIMLLKSMNPQILAMDEITASEDVEAIMQAVGCGVKLLATAHADRADELPSRPVYRPLIESRVFQNIVTISQIGGARRYSLEAAP